MKRRNFYKSILATASLPLMSFGSTEKSEMAKSNFPKKIIKPKRLKKGDTIGLITPSSPITEAQLAKTIQNIEGLGFKLKYNKKYVLSKNGYLAGSDLLRATELNRMFEDKTIDGIWCIRGGYGAARILPMLDYKMIKNNPKVLIGYSDVTALIQGIFMYTGLVCFHGPVGASDFTDYTTKHVQNVLMNPTKKYTIEHLEEHESKESNLFHSKVIAKGKAKGQLIGGNLTLITSLMGTPYDIDMKGKLIFLEDIGEKPYRIDRMLTQMILAGKFDKAKGVILGIFRGCEKKDGDRSLTFSETIQDRLGKLGIPVLYGYSFGHIKNQFTLPVGIKAEMDTKKKTVTLLEEAVS